MKSVMTTSMRHALTPDVNVKRSVFDRSHGYKTTFDAGKLYPIYADEVIPGDSFQLDVSAFARLATPIKPIMDNMYMDFFFFYVPNRLVWTNFVKFMGEQENPGDSIAYTVPKVDINTASAQATIWDYMGLPTQLTIMLN